MSQTALGSEVTAGDSSPAAGHLATGPTPDGIMGLGLGFWGSKALLSAVELGLFSELAATGRLDADALRDRLRLHQRSARDFFDALVALGMLDRTDGLYHNTEASKLFLDRAKPSYVGGILEMANARLYGYWGSLTDGLRTGTPQNEIKTGGNFFDVVYADPAKLRGFLRAMTGISAGAAQAIASAFPWERHNTFIDIGCAEGCLPVAVARAREHITGGGFDLPAVGPHFEQFVAQAGLAGRSASTQATSSAIRYRAPTCSAWGTSCTTGTSTKSARYSRRHTTRYPTAAP